jgi:branched-chain amino acid transport system permease protein
MDQLPQQLINSAWQGAALAVFALGYALVFGSLGIVNLAHGAVYAWGAMLAFLCVAQFGWPLWVALPAAITGAGAIAVLLERIAFKPLRSLTSGSLLLWAGFLVLLAAMTIPASVPADPSGSTGTIRWALLSVATVLAIVGLIVDAKTTRVLWQRDMPRLAPMIASIGASLVLVTLAQAVFGAQALRLPPGTFPDTPIVLPADLIITPIQVLVLGVALLLMIGLNVMLARTSTGRAIRAVAWSERTARLLGINVDRVISSTFFLAGGLAGAAGALLGLAYNRIQPLMGEDVELAGLTVIVIGGLGSIRGVVVAAFVVGALRVFSVAYLDSSLRDAFVFGLLILVLVVRPQGLFGRAAAVRA